MGRKCYHPHPQAIIEVIRAAGGIAVLAHPVLHRDAQLNEILNGFTGDVKKDIDYFLSVREKYRNTPDDNVIFNKCLQVLVEEMNDKQKQQFFDGMKEMGVDLYDGVYVN